MKQKIKCKATRDGNNGLRMKVENSGVKKLYINSSPIKEPLDENKDVIVCDKATGEAMFRIYKLVDQKGVPYFSCQTMNPFRHSINDCEISVSMDGKVYEGDNARKVLAEESAANKEKHPRVCITPDTIVTCNVCGNEIRVGKVLSSEK